jgi:hypothetical protein
MSWCGEDLEKRARWWVGSWASESGPKVVAVRVWCAGGWKSVVGEHELEVKLLTALVLSLRCCWSVQNSSCKFLVKKVSRSGFWSWGKRVWCQFFLKNVCSAQHQTILHSKKCNLKSSLSLLQHMKHTHTLTHHARTLTLTHRAHSPHTRSHTHTKPQRQDTS